MNLDELAATIEDSYQRLASDIEKNRITIMNIITVIDGFEKYIAEKQTPRIIREIANVKSVADSINGKLITLTSRFEILNSATEGRLQAITEEIKPKKVSVNKYEITEQGLDLIPLERLWKKYKSGRGEWFWSEPSERYETPETINAVRNLVKKIRSTDNQQLEQDNYTYRLSGDQNQFISRNPKGAIFRRK